MKMRDSEIFNNYIRLAEDAGLIGEDELQKTADPSDKTRYDRYSFSDFEALYGHKFTPNEKEGESIVEVAHPETAVAVPAYDAMNSVVENLHQRNNIMTYVALKDPDGHLVQRRYVAAQQKLINSLVSVGFEMDSLEEAGLMSLADSCASGFDKKAEIQKEAFWGAVAMGLFNVALAFGPMIYDRVVGTYANQIDEVKKADPAKQPKLRNMAKSNVKRNIGRGFKRVGMAWMAYELFQMVSNRLPDFAHGIQKDTDKLASTLDELKAKTTFDAAIDSFKQKVIALKMTHADLTSHMNASNSTNADTSYYGAFQKAWQDFYSAQGNFKALLDSMNTDVSTISGTLEEEDFWRSKEFIEASGISQKVVNAIDAVNKSAQAFSDAWSQSYPEAQKKYDQESAQLQQVEVATAQAAESAADMVDQADGRDQIIAVQQQQLAELKRRLAELEKKSGA